MLLLLFDCLKLSSSLAKDVSPVQAAAVAFIAKLQGGGQVLTLALVAHMKELAQLCMQTPISPNDCKTEQAWRETQPLSLR